MKKAEKIIGDFELVLDDDQVLVYLKENKANNTFIVAEYNDGDDPLMSFDEVVIDSNNSDLQQLYSQLGVKTIKDLMIYLIKHYMVDDYVEMKNLYHEDIDIFNSNDWYFEKFIDFMELDNYA